MNISPRLIALRRTQNTEHSNQNIPKGFIRGKYSGLQPDRIQKRKIESDDTEREMKAYSVDLRKKIIDAYENNEGSQRQIAKRFKVSLSFIQRLLKRYREKQTIEPLPHAGGFAPRLAQHQGAIACLLEADNDATLEELCSQVYERTGVSVSSSTLCRALQLWNFTRKKNHFTQHKQKA